MAGLFVIVAGIFSLCGAIVNWDWYMNHRKARFLVRILGRGGALEGRIAPSGAAGAKYNRQRQLRYNQRRAQRG